MGKALLATAALMFGVPLLAVLFAGDAGMAVCFILFFAVDPLFALWIGWFAGKAAKRRWFLPPTCAAMFLLGCWALFDMGETAFVLYALVYLVMGLLSMALSALIHRKKG